MAEEREKYLIVVAGGHGTRMGSDLPKQFLSLGGKPVLSVTIDRFIRAVPGLKVVTVLPGDWFDYWKDWCLANNFHYPQIFAPGGVTRFHSVRNALSKVPDGAIAAIHDGVRPLISQDLIRSLFARAEKCPGVIPVVPVTDTLKVLGREETASGETVLREIEGEVMDRSVAYGAQTPQLFWSELIRDAYSVPYDTAFTDDASIARVKKIPLTFVEGERYNLKITCREDLAVAEAILKMSL
ncbi:MAG: 2-C-methyl-D-erythritol 4-phosphate cytidylyltransferase [Bacteroidales bacterium]|nr:2-C-methyl-D-erythritol 4-phosphate cytidylyltransferase [Bacteroidales bacterium]